MLCTRNLRIGLVAVLAFALTGCWVQSIHPIYTDATTVFDERLVGTWDSGDGIWTFAADGEDGYEATFIESDSADLQLQFEARLTRIGEDLYLDMSLVDWADDDVAEMIIGPFVLPLHWLSRAELRDDEIELREPSIGWVRDYLKSRPGAVAHTDFGDRDGRIILTDDTEGLRRFIAEHMNVDEAWSSGGTMQRVVGAR